MEEEGSEASVATSSFTPNWWELHTNSLSSWNNTSPWQPPNPSSNSSGEEEFSISPSFTNASNQSGLSVDSSSQLVEPASSSEIMGEPTSEWSQVLLSVESSGDLHNDQDVGENFLNVLSSKDLSTEMFEPACDYLKKMDGDWEFPNSTSFSCNSEKEFNVFNGSLMENERLANLSNLVCNWSIAPPGRQEFIHQINPLTWESDISLNSSMDQYYSEPDLSQRMKQLLAAGNRNSYFLPCYGKDVKPEIQHQEIEASGILFPRSFNRNRVGQMGVNSSVVVGDNKCNNGISDASWSNARKFSEHISFNGCLSKPLLDFQASKPCLKASNSSDRKKKGHDTPLTTAKGNGRGKGVANEGKKKRSEENSETLFKRPKHETSTVSSLKMQGPKVKLGDRITALQQIVSPFGKTDTASVLLEAIGYIKFLQEQVQVLSNPYMKSNKDHPWGSQLDQRKDHKPDAKLDLKSRGLCLVPISCTPQVYRENTGSDYWTPTYRGCLYR